MCNSRILSASVWDRLRMRKGLLSRCTALQLCTQLRCKSTSLSKGQLIDREYCVVVLLSWSMNEGQYWIMAMKGVTWPMNNSTMQTAAHSVSRRAKGTQSLKGVDRLALDHVYYRWTRSTYRATVDRYIGRLSVDYRPTIDRQSVDCRPTIGR